MEKKQLNINTLPAAENIRKLYTQYYKNSRGHNESIEVSSHWRECMSLCQVQIDDDGKVGSLKGLGFGDLQYTRPWHRLANVLCIQSYMRNMDRKRIDMVDRLMRLAKPVLKAIGVPMSYDCFRQICSLADIANRMQADGVLPQRVLVIGDGYGFLSSMIKTLWPGSIVVLMDNGPVLLFQTINIQKVFPGAAHSFVGMDELKKSSEGDFWYCVAESRESLPLRDFSLVINICSMNEMTIDMIREYFKFIRLRADERNYFYCCNRELKILTGGERTAFLEYPWEAQDEIYFDEDPDFCRYYYTFRFPFKHYFEPFRHRLVRLKRS